ncbi:XXXCH domain-containing protein [Desulfonatronum thiosulfatophilum]|uniref:XXXCH domain-containing protein n=1 Tax=Desulfonatronum thiosulfatophilum TaxID=617002 RepID=A0A1G6AJ62_9BACT|nr:GAK system XXXCH domain-containing protein [Desulfonatronum thiosulfatophilum]SDB08448.1 XXXCH domain-containing protein [Desulfonatronum thiosulfatophilum]
MEREDKLNLTCTQEQLAEMLRTMADAMVHGRLRLENVEVDWKDVQKINLAIRNAAGMAEVKLKIASGARCMVIPGKEDDGPAKIETELSETAIPSDSYGSLKKRMRKSFKNIMYALHDNTWPAQSDIDGFIQDSALMVRYPGKGDEFYPAYSEAVAVFQEAVRVRDLDAAYQAAHSLNSLKTQCHKKYD